MRKAILIGALATFTAGVFFACSDDATTPPAGTDASTTDAGGDTTTAQDAPADVATDTGTDAGADTGPAPTLAVTVVYDGGGTGTLNIAAWPGTTISGLPAAIVQIKGHSTFPTTQTLTSLPAGPCVLIAGLDVGDNNPPPAAPGPEDAVSTLTNCSVPGAITVPLPYDAGL